MKKLKILFLIHSMGPGGAEKVLTNLVNNLNPDFYDITLMTLFDGINAQFLKPHIRYRVCFPYMIRGNTHLLKLLPPGILHQSLIKEQYDIEVSYLEGAAARIISGCRNSRTKLISWIHVEQHTKKIASQAFRSYGESVLCYQRFHKTICVSNAVKEDYQKLYPQIYNVEVLYNTIETEKIKEWKKEPIEYGMISKAAYRLCGVGKLMPNKGFDRLLRIHKRLCENGISVHTYILGEGSERNALERYIENNGLKHSVTLLGYQTNPYKYVAACDLFICASHAEGFSTAATEALVVGTPVCTVDVSGMKEMLGENNEYGIVTENDEEALYDGIFQLIKNPALLGYYKLQAEQRGQLFSTDTTTNAVGTMLMALSEK